MKDNLIKFVLRVEYPDEVEVSCRGALDPRMLIDGRLDDYPARHLVETMTKKIMSYRKDNR